MKESQYAFAAPDAVKSFDITAHPNSSGFIPILVCRNTLEQCRESRAEQRRDRKNPEGLLQSYPVGQKAGKGVHSTPGEYVEKPD